jgi:hypothetical protein
LRSRRLEALHRLASFDVRRLATAPDAFVDLINAAAR